MRQMLFFLVLASIGLFYFATIRSGEEWTEDSALYAQHAKNISSGEPYGKILFTYDAKRWNAGPKAYPPVFPLIIAAVYRWHGLNFTLVKGEVIGFFLLTLVAVFYAFSKDPEFQHPIALVAIIGFNPVFWDFKDAILSDIPFLFFAYLALFLIEWSWPQEEQQNHSPFFCGAVIGLAMYLAYATRAVGLALLPSVIIFSLVRAKKVTTATWITAGTFLILVAVQSISIGDFSSYITMANKNDSSLIGRVPSYLHYYLGVSSLLWDNGYSKMARLAIFAALSTLAAIGLYSQLRQRIRVWEIFAAMYLPALCIWEEARYLFPLIPLYLLYILKGVEWIGVRKERHVQNGLAAVLLIAIALSYTGKYATLDLHHMPSNLTDGAAGRQFSQFVTRNVGERDVIEYPAARTLSFYTGRHAFQYQPIGPVNDNEVWHDLRSFGVTYLTKSPFDEPFLDHFMNTESHCLDEVFSNSEFRLYHIRTSSIPGGEPCGIKDPDSPIGAAAPTTMPPT
jgi:hypothetical protein